MIDRYNFNISTNSTVDLLGIYNSSGEVRFETILFCGQHKCLIWWVYVLVFWVFPPPKTRGVVYLCNEKPEFRNILGSSVVRCTHVSDQVSLKSVTCHVSHLPGALMDALLMLQITIKYLNIFGKAFDGIYIKLTLYIH